jgi:hypothetical protein
MTERKTAGRLDFGALRRAVEQADPDSMLGFYADDAELRVLKGGAPPFELRGRAEISKYLPTVFGQPVTHHVENEVVGEERVVYEDACEYPDGDRVVVATTLEVRGGEISRQLDVVGQDGMPGARNPKKKG